MQYLLLGVKGYSEEACKVLRLPESLWESQCGGWFARGPQVESASFQLWDLGLNHFSVSSGKKCQAAKLAAGILHRTGGEVWKQKLCTCCLGQVWASENQQGGIRALKWASASSLAPDSQPAAPLTSASVCKGRNMLLKKFPPTAWDAASGRKRYGELIWLSQSRYNCYVSTIVTAILEMACTGSGFKVCVFFGEEHGCTLNPKTCLFFFNIL